MKQSYFIDKISDETLAKMIDTTIKFEKAQKSKQSKISLFKIIPAVAAIFLVIGLVSLLPMIPNFGVDSNDVGGPGAEMDIPFVITMTEATTEVEEVEEVDPYAHVRFGETRNILLLDVEWHTYETYLEYIEEFKNTYIAYKNSDLYMQLSDDGKKQLDIGYEDSIKQLEKNAKLIKNNQYHASRLINGKQRDTNLGGDGSSEGLKKSNYYTSDGYLIFKIYPYYDSVSYLDENGVVQKKYFGTEEYNGMKYVNSKSEYDDIMENEIIPFCDELLEKGLITQEDYDKTIAFDPLDYYVGLYFN